MQIQLNDNNTCLVVIKQPGDSSRNILYHLKRELQARGINVVKKLMWKDGHMVNDREHYLKVPIKAATKDQPHIWVYDPNYAIRDLDTTWKESGIVFLPIGYDIYCKQPESVGMSRMRYYIHKGVE